MNCRPFPVVRVLAVISLLTATALAQSDPAIANSKVTAEKANQTFEALKTTLTGEWEGRSTKGWVEKAKYQTIAGGSVLMETSFDAHPNEMMVTMLHMDGDHLMLTHYCIAQNQPRMRLTDVTPDGKTLTFSFLDATNLPNRDKGHMDKCVINLDGPDTFRSRWTWYQDGKENWMEEIVSRRIPAGSVTDRDAANSANQASQEKKNGS